MSPHSATAVRHEFTIPRWRPSTVNELLGRVAQRIRRKRADRDFVAIYAKLAEIPPAKGKRCVSLRIALAPRNKLCDRDALWKSLLDALVQAKLLLDDTTQWVELGSVEFVRGRQLETTIILEEAG